MTLRAELRSLRVFYFLNLSKEAVYLFILNCFIAIFGLILQNSKTDTLVYSCLNSSNI